MKVGYYILHNPVTDQVYIGSGVLKNRENSHILKLKNNVHENYKLQKAYNLNPNFDFIGVEVEEHTLKEHNRVLAFEFEQQLISDFNSFEGCLNIAKSVDAGFYGRKHSQESKDKMRQSKLELWSDPIAREKFSACQKYGWKKLSEDQRNEVSEIARVRQEKRYSNGEKSPTFGQKRTQEFIDACRVRTLKLNEQSSYKKNHHESMLGNDNAPRHEVIIEGVHYRSITEAAKHFNMSVQSVIYRLQSDSSKFNEWKFKI